MVATQTQLRRGTASQCDAMIPVQGEPIVDTTNKRLRIGDAATPGGIHHVNAKDAQDQAMVSGTATGTANAIVLTLAPALTEYKDGTTVRFKAIADNTASTNLNVNGLGATIIRKFSGAALADLSGGEIVTGNYYNVIFNGTVWILAGGFGGGGSSGVNTVIRTSSGTYSKPSNLVSLVVEVQAPGANGQGTLGGTSGGYSKKTYQASDLSSSETVTIGSTTSFKSQSTTQTGAATGGDLNIPGGNTNVAIGGSSPLGFGGAGGTNQQGGGNGRGYGSGGGGSPNGLLGSGAPGIIILTEYLR